MKPVQSIFVDVHGVRIHARTAPCSVVDAAPVVILHGFTGSVESMRGVETELTESWTTVSLDLVGHGRSDSPEDVAAYTMDRCVEQIAEVIDALGLERPHLLGYSMGGRAALSFCHRYPDRVRSALLVGASAGLPDREQRSKRVRRDEALAKRIVDFGLDAFVDEWMAQPLFASQSSLGDRFLANARVERLRNNPHGLAMSLRGMGTGAMTPLDLADMDVATCFVAGTEDEKFCAIARAFGERLPRSRFEIVAAAGHAAHLENREVFGRVARDFLAEIDAQEPRPPMLAGTPASHSNTHDTLRRRGRTMGSENWKTISEYDDIRLEKLDDGIAKITINRPEVRNAFRPETVKELIDAFQRVREDSKVGCILFTGEGDKAFCSGGDQSVRGHAGYVGGDDGVARLNVLDLQRLIRSMPKPVIALVAGYAIGGGHVLHVICDLTIAAENARFGQTGAKVGSFDAGFGSSYLARVVGQKKAREIWFTCRQYDAQQALQMGLVNDVVPNSELEAAGLVMAREIVSMSPMAIRCLKSAFNADCDGQAGIQELAGNATMLFYMSEEAQEGRQAFMEKRRPDFSRFPWRP